MSKVTITISDNQSEQKFFLLNSNTASVVEALERGLEPSKSEEEIVESFLNRVGIELAFDTPNSSWVERVSFNPITNEITFFPSSGGEVSFPANLSKFINVLKAPSIGKEYHAFRRGER
jgi:hypothetical protein